MLQKKFVSTASLLSIVTGKLLCEDFGEMHATAEIILGCPIFTHHFVLDKVNEALLAEIQKQHPDLTPELADDVNPSNVWEKRDALIERFGAVREVIEGNGDIELGFLEGIPDDKEVIVVETGNS